MDEELRAEYLLVKRGLLIPEGAEIGNSQDARHVAIAHRIMAEQEGRARLSTLPGAPPEVNKHER